MVAGLCSRNLQLLGICYNKNVCVDWLCLINEFDNLPALETGLHFTISSYFTELIQNICFYVLYWLV
jgi:hypothetical protein